MAEARSVHRSPAVNDTEQHRRATNGWIRPLVVLTLVVALGDVAHLALTSGTSRPLAAGAVVSLTGIILLIRRPKVGIAILGVTSAFLAVVAAVVVGPQLASPGAPLGFLHASLATLGRGLSAVAAIGAWREANARGARRLTASALGLAAAAVAIAAIAILST